MMSGEINANDKKPETDVKTDEINKVSPDTAPTSNPMPVNRPMKQYGITSPVSLAKPTTADVNRTKDLLQQLKNYDIFESPEDLNKKLFVLDKLNKLARIWITEFLIKKRMPEFEAKSVGGHIRTFGSYRLGVHTKNADIDAVMVAPRHVSRDDFFDSFSVFLRGRSDVKDLRCVTEAYVPVMKFTFNDIEFDLLFCCIHKHKISDDISLKSPMVLDDMDMKDIRSINGFRIADDILTLVPNPKNFKYALHAIKLWAKRQELYSNMFGFFGGITWAILMARVCQLYPYAIPSTLVSKFFVVFTSWNWDNHPVVLRKIEYGPMGMTLPQWHPTGLDQNRLMPIITPTYPEQNTTHNVTLSTRTVILNRLHEGLNMVNKVIAGKSTWNDFFVPVNFFQQYNHFVVLSADSINEKMFIEWNGYVESKLRLLIMSLEQNIFVKIAHPHCRQYEPLPSENLPYVRRWFIGLEIHRSDDKTGINIDLASELNTFKSDLLSKKICTILYPTKTIYFQYAKRRDLLKYLPREVIGRRTRVVENISVPKVEENQSSSSPSLTLEPSKRKAGSQDSLIGSPKSSKNGEVSLASSSSSFLQPLRIEPRPVAKETPLACPNVDAKKSPL